MSVSATLFYSAVEETIKMEPRKKLLKTKTGSNVSLSIMQFQYFRCLTTFPGSVLSVSLSINNGPFMHAGPDNRITFTLLAGLHLIRYFCFSSYLLTGNARRCKLGSLLISRQLKVLYISFKIKWSCL